MVQSWRSQQTNTGSVSKVKNESHMRLNIAKETPTEVGLRNWFRPIYLLCEIASLKEETERTILQLRTEAFACEYYLPGHSPGEVVMRRVIRLRIYSWILRSEIDPGSMFGMCTNRHTKTAAGGREVEYCPCCAEIPDDFPDSS
jgi:hypothetical protein